MSRHFSSKRLRLYSSFIYQMKAYDKRKCFFAILTLDDRGVTQGQGQKCKIFFVQAFVIT